MSRNDAVIIAVLAATAALAVPAVAATYQVGPARPYAGVGGLPALSAGDVVEIDPGTYNEVKRWTYAGSAGSPIIIRGVGATRPVFDATGKTVDGVMPRPRAVFQIEADFITLENLEFKNARNGNNGAGVRVTGGNNVSVRNCKITSCDMGIMSDSSDNLVIENSEIASNGTALYDGYSHNLYLGGGSSMLRYCHIHDALYGQNVKSRAHYTELLYNCIADSQDGEVGLVDAAETGAANSHAVMIGNVVIAKARLSGYNTQRFVLFGQDSGGAHSGTLFAFNNTFVAGDSRIRFLSANAASAGIIAHNNIFYGSPNIVGTSGGGVNGSNNWAQTGATIPDTFFGTRTGGEPGFVNAGARDLRLGAGSACRDQGVSALSYTDDAGVSRDGQPTREYVGHLQSRTRPAKDLLDLGAYEFSTPAIVSTGFSGDNFVIDLATDTGSNYSVQRSDGLMSDGWSCVVTNLIGTGVVVPVTDTNAAWQAQRFYRVRWLL